MKVRLEAHREAIGKAIAQSGVTAGAQAGSADATARPLIELAAALTPPAAGDRPALLATTASGSTAPIGLTAPGSQSASAPFADALTSGVETASSLASKSAAETAAPRAPVLRPTASQLAYQPAEQIKVHIQNLVKSGNERIHVRLSPASLGRVEVVLEVAPDKAVHAIVYADKADTLDMLERDARVLREAFEQAGMKFDSNGLTFRQGQAGNPGAQFASDTSTPRGGMAGDDDGDGAQISDPLPPQRRHHDGRLDLEV